MTGLATGFVVKLAFGLAAWLVVAPMAGLAAGLAFSSVASCRYMVAVGIAASARLLPLRFARFLQWACHAGILRISGNAYQFRHSELRNWLQRAD